MLIPNLVAIPLIFNLVENAKEENINSSFNIFNLLASS